MRKRPQCIERKTDSITMHSLHWFDYFILAAFLLVSVGIGVYHALTGGRQRTTSEFIMANRKLQVIPTVISMMVSFQSAIMILGIVAEMYRYIADSFASIKHFFLQET